MNFEIYSPSYKRPDICTSHKYFPDLTYVVDESEYKAYKNVHDKIIALPSGVQGNISRVRNWIMDHVPVVLIIDDDYSDIGRWTMREGPGEYGVYGRKLTPNQAMEFVEMGFELAVEFDVKMWGINLAFDKGTYREYTPFSLSSMILGPLHGHINSDIRYDEKLPLKEDYDFSIQALNEYRKILRLNMYYYKCDQHGKPGGCAAYRTINREMQQNILLRKKWGAKLIKFDTGASKTNRKNEIGFDINPIATVPIKGI